MLKIEQISKTFNPGTITEKLALHQVSLHLEPGDFVTVIGGNGAGKSTLMNSIAGTYPVDDGHILIDGTDITKWAEHKRAKYIERVFQDPMMGTAAGMMIEENLAIHHAAARYRHCAGVLPRVSGKVSASRSHRCILVWRTGWNQRSVCCPVVSARH